MSKWMHLSLVPLLLVALTVRGGTLSEAQLPVATMSSAETLIVDTTVDLSDPAHMVCSEALDDCSLRGAINHANTVFWTAFEILVPSGTYTLTLPGASEDGNATGDLDVTTAGLVIRGDGAAATIIDGGGLDRVLSILQDANLTLDGLTIRDGQAPNGAVGVDGQPGGGIYNAGTVTITHALVTGNASGAGGGGNDGVAAADGGEGGGVYNSGTMLLTDTIVSDNRAGAGGSNSGSTGGGRGGGGGGILNSGTMTLTHSAVSGNQSGAGGSVSTDEPHSPAGSGGAGGGILNHGALRLDHTTVSGNTAGSGGSMNAWASTYNQDGGLGGTGGGIASSCVGGPGVLVVVDSEISGNAAGNGGGAESDEHNAHASSGGDGGGLHVFGGPVTLERTAVTGNRSGSGGNATAKHYTTGGPAGNGGGLAVDWDPSLSCPDTVDLIDSSVADNVSGNGGSATTYSGTSTATGGDGGDGGGIYGEGSHLTLLRSAVSDNETGSGGTASAPETAVPGLDGHGGGIYNGSSQSRFEGVTFSGNVARAGGGGIYNESSSPVLVRVDLIENEASSLGGGGIYNLTSSPLLVNCTLSGNTAGGGGKGGALYNVGGTPTLVNTQVRGNWANAYGGGIYNDGSAPLLVNSSVVANQASWDLGGGMYNTGSGVPLVRNSIFWGNMGGGQLDWSTAAPDVQYSVVQGEPVFPGTGNSNLDPLFARDPDPGDGHWGSWADNDYGDLRLQIPSPAIDAGNNGAVPPDLSDVDEDGDTGEPVPVDLAGHPRFWDVPEVADSGVGPPPVVDMGAYEYFVLAKVFLPVVVRNAP